MSNIREVGIKPINPPNFRSPIADSFADKQFEIIKKYVTEFQNSLDETHDVGIWLTTFGNAAIMEVTKISFEKPVLMIFSGTVNGQESTLIQHINQLNFLLTKVPKAPEQPRRTIGFSAHWGEE